MVVAIDVRVLVVSVVVVVVVVVDVVDNEVTVDLVVALVEAVVVLGRLPAAIVSLLSVELALPFPSKLNTSSNLLSNIEGKSMLELFVVLSSSILPTNSRTVVVPVVVLPVGVAFDVINQPLHGITSE